MKELNEMQVQDVTGGSDLIDKIGDTGKAIGKFLHDLLHDC